MHLMQNVLLYSYIFPNSAPYHWFLWFPIDSNNYHFTVKSLLVGNILKFYNAREFGDTREFWPTVADCFKEALISCARVVRIEEKYEYGECQYNNNNKNNSNNNNYNTNN